MERDKKDFIETILTWFRSPQVGNDEELDRKFLASAYDNITQPHWISVEDELPPKNEAYLAFWQHLGVTRYRFVKSGAKVSRTFSEHITHWMPMPEVPKKGGEE